MQTLNAKRFTAVIREDLNTRLRVLAAEERKTISSVVEAALEEFFTAYDHKKKPPKP